MPTNIGGIVLGDLVLGIESTSVFNRSVTSTITFTQEISKNYNSILDTYTPTQNITFSHVFVFDVVSTLSLTQNIQDLHPEIASSTITFSQTISYTKQKIQLLSQSIAFTETIVESHIFSPTIVHGLNWIHTRAYNDVALKTISQPIGLFQTVVGDFCKVVTSLFNPTQTISYIKTKSIVHTLEWQQAFNYPVSFTRPINTIFPVFQTITHTKKLNKSLSQSLNLSQTIVQARVKFVSQTLGLTQSIVGNRTNSVKNTLTLSQIFNAVHNSLREINQPLNLNQLINLTRNRNFETHHGLGFNSIITRHQKIITRSIINTLNLDSQIRFNVYEETINQTLSLTQTINYTHIVPGLINQTLNLSQTIGLSKVSKQSVSDTLIFLPNRTVYLGLIDGQYITIDNIQYSKINYSGSGSNRTKNRPHCVLQTNTAVITLPSPDWTDTENYDGIFTIRRSMDGVPYTYVRVLELRKLKLPFTLDESKAFELREFLLQNNTKLMTLTTWKGDKWFVYLTSNPMEFSKRGRYLNANEKVETSLEFEGLKVM